ncbi:Hypoxic response protein 1 [archaeon HR06]|nr:Hypoxic response protein 1 [archaeon HR06]
MDYEKEIEEYIRRDFLVLNSEDNAKAAAKLMSEKGQDAILVEKGGEIVGIVTERDLFNRVLAKGLDPNKVKLSEVMSSPLISINRRAKVKDAIALMSKNNCRRLVVKDDGKIIGIITQRSIVGDLASDRIPLAELEIPKGVTCPYCGSIFSDKKELSKHIDRIHIGSGLLEGDIRKW